MTTALSIYGPEVFTGPGLAWSPYPARQMEDDFSNGPGRKSRGDFFQRTGLGRQMKGNFFNGPGRAGNLEVIFPTGRAGLANERWFFQQAGLGLGLKNRPVQTSTTISFMTTIFIFLNWLKFLVLRMSLYHLLICHSLSLNQEFIASYTSSNSQVKKFESFRKNVEIIWTHFKNSEQEKKKKCGTSWENYI